ncbi:phosphate ABC transporter substrate-binding/OmpA family protein [Endozoicomonas numazuensis]|uniref:phosphate ABC transporter substrate-binding/OmpA family protein n=1 Tax=Endozoicomonas numazuensis TaxID=1137799 RepID=UPI00068A981A|nr:phosphate ABC transporter substrate-binding/OmpA family protein [Endozoicomonas numazuensis]
MTITKTLHILLFSTLVALFSANSQAQEELLFSIHGSNTVGAKLGPSLAESYLKYLGAQSVGVFPTGQENEVKVTGFLPGKGQLVSIFIAAHGSSSGFKALVSGEGQVAAASRPIKKKEQAKLSEMGDFSAREAEYVVGIDGLAIIVNQDNGISKLDIKEVARLFSGEVANWKELGGADLPVSLHARDNRSGTWDTFKNLVLAKKYKLAASAERFESNTVLSDRVASTPGGIGFVSLNTIGRAKPLMISEGTERALEPELLHVSTEDYVLSRRLYMYLPEKGADPEALDFLRYATSDLAQPVVASVGYVHQAVELMSPDVQSAPQDYQDIVDQFDRASVNFRFAQGRAQLDNKAISDIERLARFIERQPGEVLLIGFAEQSANARNADLLARLRADVVRRALIKAGVSRKKIQHKGYGQFMALSSTDSLASKIRNRRVEVWVKSDSKPQQVASAY